jgi:hypothetical protein
MRTTEVLASQHSLFRSLLGRIRLFQPDRLIFSLGSVYRAPNMRETFDVKRAMRLTG